jgi:glycine/D-amino acid oxidase-like deaminating enzyme
MDEKSAAVRPALERDAQADVCVIGAGMAGLSTAYLLAKEGQKVVVVDDGPVGGGQTERTSAHLSNAIDDRYIEIERCHGRDGARLAAESHTAAIDRIEAIVNQEGIECEFERVDGYLFAPPDEPGELLDRELAAAHRAGLVQVESIPNVPLAIFDTGKCLRFPRQAQFHPLKYLAGLTAAIQRLGNAVYSHTHVSGIEPQQGEKSLVVSTTAGPTIRAKFVVVATNTPINDRFAIHTKQAPYLSYVIALRIPASLVVRALYWDTHNPYH